MRFCPLAAFVRTLAAALLVAAASAAAGAQTASTDEARTALRFAAVRSDPDRLFAFLAAMPKGADLHNHASGAVYAENYVAWAFADNGCYVAERMALAACGTGTQTLADGVARDPELVQSLVRALSMQSFVPGAESGHDHFFATFGKFGALSGKYPGRVTAAATRDAARNGVERLELMQNVGAFDDLAALAAAAPFDPERLADDDAALEKAGAAAAAARARTAALALERDRRAALGCGRPEVEIAAACAVDVAYIYQLTRTAKPEIVFAQARIGFALAADPASGYAGINIVAPEDDPVAVRDYALHMRIIGYFHRRYPAVHISLHAGELTPALVPAAALTDHIRAAVEVAGAERIGHGVDVLGERDPVGLLAEMAAKHVLVEICLTSNDVILGVRGDAHPLRAYLAAGVPVALATDDPGVSRGSLTLEYLRAVQTYPFDYRTLKALARESLRHAFVPPERRAALERRLDTAFAAFEQQQAAAP